jgi:Collagen triple helix repeat (20 copies)
VFINIGFLKKGTKGNRGDPGAAILFGEMGSEGDEGIAGMIGDRGFPGPIGNLNYQKE